jgi:biotin synthase
LVFYGNWTGLLTIRKEEVNQLSETNNIVERVLKGKILSSRECENIMHWPDEDILTLLQKAYTVRKNYFGNNVHIQLLSNAKSGLCSEDCRYCAQSSVSKAQIKKYPLIKEEELFIQAKSAVEITAKRFCMAVSGIRPSEKEINELCTAVSRIKKEADIQLCCSIGFLTRAQARKLKQAGLDRVNHNLNTSRRFYGKICTTHSFQDRVNNINICREAGLEICSGGIIGLGETDRDVIDMLLILRELDVDSIPINFLIPIKGTPFENRGRDLNPLKCLKFLCLARFLNPSKEIRLAAGREYHLRSLQPLIFFAVNSIFVEGYLTTGGQETEESIRMIKEMGFNFQTEG